MKGKGSIPAELQEAVGILRGKVLPEAAWLGDSTWGQQHNRKQDTIARLILKAMAERVPLAKEQVASAYISAYETVRSKCPELFQSPPVVGNVSRNRKAESERVLRRCANARQLLDGWLREWMRCGYSAALLMAANPDIEEALQRWWKRPVRFRWGLSSARIPSMPDAIPVAIEVHPAIRPSAEATACRALWTILNHPMRTRFKLCENCERIYFASTGREKMRFCSRACSSRNSRKPYMAEPEQAKLEVAHRLLARASGKDWKRWLLGQPEALKAGITGNWLTRRINEGKLSLPDRLESVE